MRFKADPIDLPPLIHPAGVFAECADHPSFETLATVALFATATFPARAEDDPAGLTMFSTIGKESRVLAGGKEAELLRHQGKGCLTHMWFGGDWPGYEKTRIRVYVDGEKTASIDMELGLGHGYGFGEAAAPWGGERLGKTGHPSGVYNTYRIPFGKDVRVTAQRDKGSPDAAFWWIVRGTENLPVTIGGVRLPEAAQLKLYRRRITPRSRSKSSTFATSRRPAHSIR